MTLPAGLASHSARMDDTPHARGAIAFCRSASTKAENQTRTAAIPDRIIADHAALVISAGYRMKDRRDDHARL